MGERRANNGRAELAPSVEDHIRTIFCRMAFHFRQVNRNCVPGSPLNVEMGGSAGVIPAEPPTGNAYYGVVVMRPSAGGAWFGCEPRYAAKASRSIPPPVMFVPTVKPGNPSPPPWRKLLIVTR